MTTAISNSNATLAGIGNARLVPKADHNIESQEVPQEVQEAFQKMLQNEFPEVPKEKISALRQDAYRAVLPYQGETSLNALVAAVFQKRAALTNGMVMDDLSENQRRNGDLQDVRNMLAEMRQLLAGKKDDDAINVEDSYLTPDPHSQLGQSAGAAKQLLAELTNDPEFRAWCASQGRNPDAVRIDADGYLGTQNLDADWKWQDGHVNQLPPGLQEKVKDLGLLQAAKTVGGQLRSGATVRLHVMLEYYGVKPSNPKTANEGLAAIESLKGISDTYASKSQTEMMKLQQNMGKLDVTFTEWKKMFGDILESTKAILR